MSNAGCTFSITYHHCIPTRILEWETVCFDPGVLEFFLPFPSPKVANDMTGVALTPQHVLVAHQTLQSYRSSGVDPSRTDSNFRTEAVSKPICESRAGIPKGPGGVHSSDKRRSVPFGLCDDRVGVVRRMGIDVLDCV